MQHSSFISTSVLISTLFLGGCAANAKNSQDPYECFNRSMYSLNKTLDKTILKPLATAYSLWLPLPVRTMTHNFLQNLDDIPTAANGWLQGRWQQAASDTTRLMVNSTLGVGGLIDVASRLGTPKHNNDFGQTLASWGYRQSAFLVLPLFGPSTVRDGVGRGVNFYMSPLAYVHKHDLRDTGFAVTILDTRVSLFKTEKIVEAASVDEYALVKDAYLRHRDYEINGKEDNQHDDRLDEPPA